ncbi:MAG: alcohol dehydrogenase catalytic domain-containing protein [Pseudomonadota bacterium]
MKALVYTGPHAMEVRDVADPTPAASDELLIRVEACGICGSDMHAWHGHDDRRPAPLVLGHEAVGTIVEGNRAGTRVAVNPLVTCQTCEHCLSGRENLCFTRQIISMPPREGAFSQFIAVPERNLVAVPDHVKPVAASLTEPLACGWHAVRLADQAMFKPMAEARVLVLGGGAIGLGAALALRIFGATDIWIAETNEVRHAALNKAGDFKVYDPRTGKGPEDNTVDLIIDGVGYAATREAATATVKSGGTIVHIGLGEATGGLDIRRMTLQEITFIGTYTYTVQDFKDTAAAIFDGRYGPLDWIDLRSIDAGPAAFQEIDRGQAHSPKIILAPWS